MYILSIAVTSVLCKHTAILAYWWENRAKRILDG